MLLINGRVTESHKRLSRKSAPWPQTTSEKGGRVDQLTADGRRVFLHDQEVGGPIVFGARETVNDLSMTQERGEGTMEGSLEEQRWG